ncbi:TAXI family TRAP transporter solute-binding subunit [Bradyrhizobium lablabi]|uniref:TAXI family TRAP transporter solute-binding subunit n=1 Tax=Bradyrhizobium lablabi TaxID=722472 RepID=UPI001BA63F31|nr:TAXI family TRAP transporter solute-binding subunit [Bradyrhizobium lablabi]MBR0695310.1 TRAP transporter substrate-binding protein [Bradyrhizobium lablabi]
MRRLFGLVMFITVAACSFAARAEQTEFDPAKVSDSLKAIFQFGSTSTKQSLNANTVTLISGTIGGTYVQFGADLASVLDDGNKLRVLPIVGRGSVQSVADILFLQGVDLGIVRSDTLDYLERKGFAKGIKKQFTYVTKLYNEEMHVVASKSVQNLKELDGKTISVDLPNGGTFVTALTVFERLGMKPKVVYIEQRIALEKLKAGEIDAVIVCGGKPYKSVSGFKDDRFHLVTVDYDKALQDDYLPASLSAKDYPNLISGEERVDTIAVPAVLAAYNWGSNTERYRKLTTFVDAFFTKFPTFQNAPFHPKWREVSLSAQLPGWQRFPAAQQWLDHHGVEAATRSRFDEFLKQNPTASRAQTDSEKEALFKQFRAWETENNARAQARPNERR